jgi:hypothetical protein
MTFYIRISRAMVWGRTAAGRLTSHIQYSNQYFGMCTDWEDHAVHHSQIRIKIGSNSSINFVLENSPISDR